MPAINNEGTGPFSVLGGYITVSAEAEVQDDECGKLIHWLYGCRPAAHAWEVHYSALLKEYGFRRLRSVPVAVVHEIRDLMGVVHIDDFVLVGLDEDLDFVLKVLESRCVFKNRERLQGCREIRHAGPDHQDHRRRGYLEGDPRHKGILVKYLIMNDAT